MLPQIVAPASNAQITGRVAPTLIDLVAATATGLAGSLAIARRDIGDILPGVAIAISLVPPLAVVGITAADGAWDDALGALLLFTTNVLAIIVAGSLLYSLLEAAPGQPRACAAAGVPRRRRRRHGDRARALGRDLPDRAAQQRQAAASEVGASWAQRNGEQLVNAHYEGEALVLLVEGDADGSDDAQLLAAAHGRGAAGHADRDQPRARDAASLGNRAVSYAIGRAPEADVAHAGVDHLGAPGRGAVAPAVAVGAQEGPALDDPARDGELRLAAGPGSPPRSPPYQSVVHSQTLPAMS